MRGAILHRYFFEITFIVICHFYACQFSSISCIMHSVFWLWHCCLGDRKGIWPVKITNRQPQNVSFRSLGLSDFLERWPAKQKGENSNFSWIVYLMFICAASIYTLKGFLLNVISNGNSSINITRIFNVSLEYDELKQPVNCSDMHIFCWLVLQSLSLWEYATNYCRGVGLVAVIDLS